MDIWLLFRHWFIQVHLSVHSAINFITIFGKNCKMNLHASLSEWPFACYQNGKKQRDSERFKHHVLIHIIYFYLLYQNLGNKKKSAKCIQYLINDVMNITFFLKKYTKFFNKAGDANSSLYMFIGRNVFDFLYMNHGSDIHKCPDMTTSLCHSITNENINKL